MIGISPLFKKVFIVPDEAAKQTKSGILLAENADKLPVRGMIAFVGPETTYVKQGDAVLFKKYQLDEVEIDGVKYLVGDEEDVLAILDEKLD